MHTDQGVVVSDCDDISALNRQDDQGKTQLHKAVEAGNMTQLQDLLEAGANPNIADQKGITPAHVVCQTNVDQSLLQTLISFSNDINLDLQDHGDLNNALMACAVSGSVTKTSLILSNHPNLVLKNDRGNNALMAAANAGQVNTSLLLFSSRGFSITDVNKDGENVFILACKHVNASSSVVATLISQGGIDHQQKDSTGANCFNWACQLNNTKVAQYFMSTNMANYSHQDDFGFTPLTLAVIGSDLRVVRKILIQSQTKQINWTTSEKLDHLTPLHYAILHRGLEMVQLLTKFRADLNAQSLSTNTPLWLAMKENKIDISLFLLQQRSTNLEWKDKGGRGSPHIAAMFMLNSMDVVKAFINLGMSVTALDNHRRTPFHLACIVDNHLFVKYFIENNLATFDNDLEGANPVINACKNKAKQVLPLLLQARPDLINTPETTFGNTPLHIAIDLLDDELIQTLLRHNASTTIVNKNGRDAQVLFAMNTHFKRSLRELV